MASSAASIAHQKLGRQQALTTLNALRRANGLQRRQTVLTHGQARNVYKGKTTELAIGGEKYGEDTACYGNNWRDEGRTLLGALYSSLSL